jgi:hypothetical protein
MMQIENWRGLWNLLTTYAVNDIAYYEGSSYFALDINTGKAPILANIGVYWSPVALAGEQGIQGQQGVIGPTGIQGVPGIQGPAGNPGIQGIQGNQGDRGPEGLPGIKGDTGSQGIQGVKGDTGIQGVPGVQGVKGDIGDTGQGLVWRNTWEAIATYNTYDCVPYEGASYICLAPNVLNVSPDSDDSKWGLLAQGGGTIDWSEIKDVPTTVAGYGITDLSPVATSGSYNDLNNKPTLNFDPAGSASTVQGSLTAEVTRAEGVEALKANTSSLAPVAFSGDYADLSGTPTLGTAATQNSSAFDPAGTASTVQTNLTSETSRALAAEGLLVPKTTTINGKALSSNVTLAITDFGGTLPHAQLPTLLSTDIPSIPESQVTNLVNDLAATEKTANKGAVNGYAGLDANGQLYTSQLPALAIVSTSVVSSQTAMLALTAQQGDVAIREDINETFILAASDPTLLANWKQILTPASPVQSVNGQTGIVNLAIPAAQVNSDWASGSGVTQILNKPTLGTAAAQNSSAFDSAGSAATVQTNLTSEVSRATTAEGLLVPKTTTVNGHALSANVTVSASDLTTGTLPVGQLPTIPYSQLSGTPTIPSVPLTTIQNNGVTVTPVSGTVNLIPGSNVTLTTSGDSITVASTTTFSALTGSTNTTAAMVVGTGSSIAATGTGTITATSCPTETTRAEAAEALLLPITTAASTYATQTNLTAEVTRAEAAEALLVAKTTTIAGHPLSGNVTVAYTDLTGLPTLGTAASHASTDFDSSGAAASVQTTVSASISAETARAEAAEAVLTTAVAGKQSALGYTPENLANKGVASGYPTLDSTAHIPINQLPASVQGAMSYVGVWNAATNTPAISSGVGTKGFFYKVSVAGSTTVDGNSIWHVGDMLIFDGAAWDKIDNYEAVTSVVGRTGAITLSEADITGLVADLGTLTAGIAGEVTRAEGIEATLAANLAAEVTRAEGVESTLAPIAGPLFNGPVGIDVATPDQALTLATGDAVAWMQPQRFGGGGGTLEGGDTSDTGLSRTDVGVVAVGNGQPGDTSGSLQCAVILAGNLANSATTDTTNAANITSGVLPLAQVPAIPVSKTTGFATVATTGTYSSLTGLPAIPVVGTVTPVVDGAASIGSTGKWADAGHIHPTDTSRVATSTTVNGHTLSSNVVVSASDLTTGTLPVAQLPTIPYSQLSGSPTLGNAAPLNVGTTSGTVAAGDDPRLNAAVSTARAVAFAIAFG